MAGQTTTRQTRSKTPTLSSAAPTKATAPLGTPQLNQIQEQHEISAQNLSGSTLEGGDGGHDGVGAQAQARAQVEFLISQMASQGVDTGAILKSLSQQVAGEAADAPAPQATKRNVKTRAGAQALKRARGGGKTARMIEDNRARRTSGLVEATGQAPSLSDAARLQGLAQAGASLRQLPEELPAQHALLSDFTATRLTETITPGSDKENTNPANLIGQVRAPLAPVSGQQTRFFNQTQEGAQVVPPDADLDGHVLNREDDIRYIANDADQSAESRAARKRGRRSYDDEDYQESEEGFETDSRERAARTRRVRTEDGQRVMVGDTNIDPSLRGPADKLSLPMHIHADSTATAPTIVEAQVAVPKKKKKATELTVNEKAKRAMALAQKAKPPRIREPWSDQDTQILTDYVEMVGLSYAAIHLNASVEGKLQRRDPNSDTGFSTRGQVDLKDKVRNIKMDYLKMRLPLPVNFANFPLNQVDRRKLESLGINYEQYNVERQETEDDRKRKVDYARQVQNRPEPKKAEAAETEVAAPVDNADARRIMPANQDDITQQQASQTSDFEDLQRVAQYQHENLQQLGVPVDQAQMQIQQEAELNGRRN